MHDAAARHFIAGGRIWVGAPETLEDANLPEQDHSPRYDLSGLQPLLDQGYTLLTPTVRLARRIRQEWDLSCARSGLSVWKPAAIAPLETYLQTRWRSAMRSGDVPARILIDATQLTELWRRVISDDQADRGDAALLQVGAAAELAQEARELLLRWRLDATSPALAAEFRLDADCASFHRWLLRFQRELHVRGMASAADLLTDLLAMADPQTGPPAVLLDFDDIQPLQLACLQHLCAEVRQVSGARAEAEVEVHAYPDRNAELQAVAEWTAGQHRAAPRRSLGIILADASDRDRVEYLLRREFGCLGQNYTSLPVNFSTGISLDRAPVVRDALLALATAGDSMPLHDLLVLLRSRFIAGEDATGDPLVSVLQQLYRDGRRDVGLARLRYLCQRGEDERPAAAAALMGTETLRLRRQSLHPSAWAVAFGKVLEAWGWPGTRPLDSLEYQQVALWYSTLDVFAGCDELQGEIAYGDALALLSRLCQGQVSQPQTADSPVQVLGPLEGAGLHFDHIWWVGLQGSRWPAAPQPNPFLPLALQRRHEMPHSSAEREWQYAEALLRQYRGGCPRMTVSYARHIDGIPDLPSALVSGFPQQAHGEAPGVPDDWSVRQAGAELHPCSDHAGPAVGAEERERLTGGSAILAAQSACPFRAFAAHRLGLEPLQPAVTGLSAAERGKLLHEALYLLWGEIGDSATLHAMDCTAQARVIDSAVDTALAAMPAPLRLLAGEDCLQLEGQRLQSLLREWLVLERKREPFEVVAREEELSTDFAGLPLQLRIDRVDRMSGGRRVLIDYKSGRCRLGEWLGRRVREPQLPLYGVVTDMAGIGFAQVRPRDCKFVGVADIEGTPGIEHDLARALSRYPAEAGNWEELIDRWRTDLELLVREFLAGQAAVTPQSRACDYCGFPALCRVGLDPDPGVFQCQ